MSKASIRIVGLSLYKILIKVIFKPESGGVEGEFGPPEADGLGEGAGFGPDEGPPDGVPDGLLEGEAPPRVTHASIKRVDWFTWAWTVILN